MADIPESARQAIEAARKAIAEGEAIVQRTREQLGLKGHGEIGPKERQWRRGEFGRPPVAEIKPGPDYFLSTADRENVQAVITMMAMARVSKRPGTRKAMLYAVGMHLQRLRNALGRDWIEFAEIVRRECGFGKSYAYKIMHLADPAGEKAQENASGEGHDG